MMRWKIGLFAVLLAIGGSLAACGDKAKDGDDDSEESDDKDAGGISISAKEIDLDDFELEASHAEFSFLNGTKTKDDETTYAPIARVTLSDSELERGKPKGDGVVLHLSIRGKYSDDKDNKKVPEGEYEINAPEMSVEVEIRKKDKTVYTRKAKGTVEVTKSTEKKIEGTIDIEQDGVEVKGDFSASAR